MTKILFSRPMPDRVIAAARDSFEVEVRERNTPMSRAEMRAGLALYDGIVPTLGDLFKPAIFADFDKPRCRILASFGAGYNHIDVEAANAAGLVVSNTPDAVTEATADIALTLMLMSCRRAGEGERLVRAGKWEGWHPTQLLGQHLTGKTVGIVGMGRIGQAIGRRCHFGFGCQVIYANRSEKQVDYPARQVSLPDLASAADVVVVAVPGGVKTHHLIGKSVFDAMKPTAHFVNIARGDVVEEACLIKALQSGDIAGAGLDVYEFEPDVPDALVAMENVTLLPHLGTAALEAREEMGLLAVENLRAFFEGREMPSRV